MDQTAQKTPLNNELPPLWKWLGYLTTFMEVGPLAQAWTIFSERQANQVSLTTFLFSLTVGAIWLRIGFLTKTGPLILGNGIKLLSSLLVIIGYAIYK